MSNAEALSGLSFRPNTRADACQRSRFYVLCKDGIPLECDTEHDVTRLIVAHRNAFGAVLDQIKTDSNYLRQYEHSHQTPNGKFLLFFYADSGLFLDAENLKDDYPVDLTLDER